MAYGLKTSSCHPLSVLIMSIFVIIDASSYKYNLSSIMNTVKRGRDLKKKRPLNEDLHKELSTNLTGLFPENDRFRFRDVPAVVARPNYK